MNAHAAPFVPLFDTLFSAKPAWIAEAISVGKPNPAPLASTPSASENCISIARAYERLSVLAQLELPFSIQFANPRRHLPRALIKTVKFGGEGLVIDGDGFNLQLHGPNFHTLRLVHHTDAADGCASLEICHPDGLLYASIQPIADGVGCEVWCDVMENPSLSLS